jgi:hypothetical protein
MSVFESVAQSYTPTGNFPGRQLFTSDALALQLPHSPAFLVYRTLYAGRRRRRVNRAAVGEIKHDCFRFICRREERKIICDRDGI